MKIETDKLVQVFFEDENGMTLLRSASGEATPLHELPLVVEGAPRVLCEGKVYDLGEQGLYRFSVAPHFLQNVIVHSSDSLLPLLQSLASLQIHGNKLEGCTDEEILRCLREDSCISVTCGTIARMAKILLAQQGIESRFVAGLTLDQWNAYDNGHTLLELLWPGAGWVLADLDMGLLFRDDNKLLNLYEVSGYIRDGRTPELVKLATAKVDPHFYLDGYNMALIREWSWRSDEAIWEWYCRVFQTVSVLDPDEGYVYFGHAARVREYCGEGTSVLDEQSWIKKFYE